MTSSGLMLQPPLALSVYPKGRGKTSFIQGDGGEALDAALADSAADKSQRRLLLPHYMEIVFSKKKKKFHNQQLHQESVNVSMCM